MGRGGSNDFKGATGSQFAKRGKQIAFASIHKEALGFAKDFRIKVCQLMKPRMFAVSLSFARGEIDQKIEMPHIALTKQLILQHRAERRRDRDGKLKRHKLINQALHHAHQWDVTLGHRLEEPVFFEEMLMFGMTNEWKMRVKNERKRTGHRGTFNVSFRAKRGTSHEAR